MHYVRTVPAGLGAALLGALLYAQVTAQIPFGSLILAGVLGFVIGRVVRWGSRGQTQQPFLGIAIVFAAVSVAAAFLLRFGTPVPPSLITLLAYPIALWLAARGLQG